MSLQVRFQPFASLEVSDAARWYDRQQNGLGDRFLAAVSAAVERASRWPNAGTPVEVANDGTVLIRRVVTADFPYAVGYEVSEVSEDTLTVLAVFHQHRRPNYWTANEP